MESSADEDSALQQFGAALKTLRTESDLTCARLARLMAPGMAERGRTVSTGRVNAESSPSHRQRLGRLLRPRATPPVHEDRRLPRTTWIRPVRLPGLCPDRSWPSYAEVLAHVFSALPALIATSSPT
jgi:hypothetical protein